MPRWDGCWRSDLEKAGLPAIFGPNSLVFRFPADYNASGSTAQEPTRVQRIEETAAEDHRTALELRIESVGSGAVAAPAAGCRRGDDLAIPLPIEHRAEAEKEPLVKRAVEVLGAQIVRVDDGFGEAPAASGDAQETRSLTCSRESARSPA